MNIQENVRNTITALIAEGYDRAVESGALTAAEAVETLSLIHI